MIKAQRIVGSLFTVLGIYVTLYSFINLGVGTMRKPGPGFFTLICGSGILILSVLWVIIEWKSKDDTPLFEKGAWISPLIGIGITLIYALLMEPLGYILSTAVFIVLWQVIIAKAKILTIIVFAVIGSVSMYVLFKVLLGVPVSGGFFGF